MDITTIKKPLKQFHSEVSKSIAIEEMIIFGSYARGTANEESDVDVIVISDDFNTLPSPQRLSILDKASGDIEPMIVAAGFTKKEFGKFGKLSMLGHARKNGFRFNPQT